MNNNILMETIERPQPEQPQPQQQPQPRTSSSLCDVDGICQTCQ